MAAMGEGEMVDELGKIKSVDENRDRSTNIQLTNHLTGWNALCELWDSSEMHRERLKALGYGEINYFW